MLRAAALVLLSNGAGTILSFLRNVLIGRMVSVEDFGIVSTFALAFAIIQTATYAGFDRLLVQAKDGGTEAFQQNLQFLQVFRGLFGALFFLLFAWPYAWFLDNLDIYWAYLLMSLVPLLRGFLHFDIYRRQRTLEFGPTALVNAGSPLVSLLITFALIWVVTDFRIIIIAIIAQQATFVLISHRVATRPWIIRWNRDVALRALHFGWPLLANGVLVFAIHNGDMLLVGGYFGMETLGWFYVATMVTITMTLHMDTTVRSIMLPKLSQSADVPEEFARRCLQTLETSTAFAIGSLLFIHLLGSAMVVGLFGSSYASALDYLVPLALLYTIKSMKAGPSVIAISLARTRLPIYTNLPRGLGFFVSLGLLMNGADLPTIIVVAILAELICVAIAFALLLRINIEGIPGLSDIVWPIMAYAVVAALVCIDVLLAPSGTTIWETLPPSRIATALAGLAVVAALPRFRRFVMRRLRRKSAV